MSYATIEVPTERTELDEEVAMFLVRMYITAEGRNEHLAGIAIMRELARQFPTADMVEISDEWSKRIKKAITERREDNGAEDQWYMEQSVEVAPEGHFGR